MADVLPGVFFFHFRLKDVFFVGKGTRVCCSFVAPHEAMRSPTTLSSKEVTLGAASIACLCLLCANLHQRDTRALTYLVHHDSSDSSIPGTTIVVVPH